MNNLLALDIDKLAGIGAIILAMIVISVFSIGFVLTKIMKALNVQKISSGKLSLEMDNKHSNDSITIPKKDYCEGSDVIYTNLLGHNYFRDLKRVINIGAQINCHSAIKAQFIKEFINIYSKTLLEVLGVEVSKIIDDPKHDLTAICDGSIVERLKNRYHECITQKTINIEYEGTIYKHKGIPSLLYAKFDDTYLQLLTILLDQAEDIIADDSFHKDWIAKLTGILDVLDLSYKRDFLSLNGIIQTINGDMDRYFEEDFLTKINKKVPA